MEITASMVKELRERSGAGMMECKKALTETKGDIEAAIDLLRKQGLAKADKKAGRVAAEGRIVLAQDGGKAVMVEVNSETDFVAKDENFLKFADEVAAVALTSGANDVEALKNAKLASGQTVEEGRQALVAKVGENVQIRRLMRVDGNNTVGAYLYGQPYVLNTDQSVEAAAKAAGADVLGFKRLAVGEGIEKPTGDDFATEVMKQAGLK